MRACAIDRRATRSMLTHAAHALLFWFCIRFCSHAYFSLSAADILSINNAEQTVEVKPYNEELLNSVRSICRNANTQARTQTHTHTHTHRHTHAHTHTYVHADTHRDRPCCTAYPERQAVQ